MVLSGSARRDLAAVRESNQRLSEADWAVLTKYAPKPIWDRILEAKKRLRGQGAAGAPATGTEAQGPPTGRSRATVPDVRILTRPDGKIDMFCHLQHIGGPTVSSTRDGGTDRRKVTTKAADLTQVVTLIKAHLAKDEIVTPLPAENRIVITCAPERRQAVLDLLAEVDTPTPQVEITSRIFEVNHDFDFQLGAKLLLSHMAGDNSQGWASQFSAKDFAESVVDPLAGAVADPGSAFRLLQVFEKAGVSMDATFQALAEVGLITVVATPRMTVAAGQTAYVLAGQELPIQSAKYVNDKFIEEKVSYRPTGVQMYITPQIVGQEAIKLHVVTTVSAVAGFGPRPTLTASSAVAPVTNPIFDSREAETYVTVRDAETLVIGGLRMVRTITRESKVPGLGDVEGMEWLFKNHRSKKVVNDLYFFVTPRLVSWQSSAPQAARATAGPTPAPAATPAAEAVARKARP